MTTTEEQFASDNSDLKELEKEPQIQAQSENEQLASKSFQPQKEPEAEQNQAVNQVKEVQKAPTEIPEKFKNKDGSVNLDSLIKSYKELEPLINEKAQWAKEKESLSAQISNSKSQNLFSDLSKIGINFFKDAAEKSSDPDKAKELIEKYQSNPNSYLLKELETLYSPEDLKEIYSSSMEKANEMASGFIQKIQQEELDKTQTYLNEVVSKNQEALKNPITAELFNEAFLQFGTDLDSDWFFEKIDALKNSFIFEYQKSQEIQKEAQTATSSASKLSPQNSVKNGGSLLSRNALELSPAELTRMFDEYYSK